MSRVRGPLRHASTVATCWVMGAVAAWALHSALQPPPPQLKLSMSKARMSVRSAPAAPAAAAAPLPPLPQTPHILPLRTEKAAPQKSTVKQTAPLAKPAAEPVVVPPVPAAELPKLEQPVFAGPVAQPPVTELPRIPGSEAPPMPGAEPVPGTFQLAAVEKPGGDILVLGVLVNDQGVVEETLIVVPSRFALGDIGMALGYRGQRWSQLDPPMEPGTKRWLELRIDHAGRDPAKGSLLP